MSFVPLSTPGSMLAPLPRLPLTLAQWLIALGERFREKRQACLTVLLMLDSAPPVPRGGPPHQSARGERAVPAAGGGVRLRRRARRPRADRSCVPATLQDLLPRRRRPQADGGLLDGPPEPEGHGHLLLRPAEVPGVDGAGAVWRTERRRLEATSGR